MQEQKITNARFVDIGSNRVVLAGTASGMEGYRDGQTFYSEPVDAIDGSVVRCGEQEFKFERNFGNV